MSESELTLEKTVTELDDCVEDFINNLRKPNIIQSKKFHYDKIIFNIIADSLARATNYTYAAKQNGEDIVKDGNKVSAKNRIDRDGTIVIALVFDTCITAVKNTFSINNIYFSQKGNVDNHSNNIKNFIKYCCGESDENYLSEEIKRDIFQLFKKINVQGFVVKNFKSIFSHLNIDEQFLKNFYEDLSSIIMNKLVPTSTIVLHNLIILFFDILVLRDIVSRHFELDTERLNVFEIKREGNSLHPDVKIISGETKFEKGTYIGISHLCCFKCSVFLDSFGYDFRGINKKFEQKWILPTLNEHDQNNLQIFEKKLLSLKDSIKRENKSRFNIEFANRRCDEYQHTCDLYSDDIHHFLDYYKDLKEKNTTAYYFILNDFNENPFEKLKELYNGIMKIIGNNCYSWE